MGPLAGKNALTNKFLPESRISVSSRQRGRNGNFFVTRDVNVNTPRMPSAEDAATVDVMIGEHARLLSSQLQAMSEALFPRRLRRRFDASHPARLLA